MRPTILASAGDRLDAEVPPLHVGVPRQLGGGRLQARSHRRPSRAVGLRARSRRRASARSAGSRAPPPRSFLKVSIRTSMTVGARPSDGSSMIRSLGISEQRAADREHLLLAAGELGAAVSLPVGEPREELVHALDRPRAAPSARGDPEMLVDGQRRKEPAPLRDVAEPGARDLVRRLADELDSVESRGAGHARGTEAHESRRKASSSPSRSARRWRPARNRPRTRRRGAPARCRRTRRALRPRAGSHSLA